MKNPYSQVKCEGKVHSTKHFKNKQDCIDTVHQLRERVHSYATVRAF